MMNLIRNSLYLVSVFFIIYLVVYAAYAFFAVLLGAHKLYINDRKTRFLNNLTQLNKGDLPVSILVPAHNEAVSIVNSIKSLLSLDYRKFEIILIDDGSSDDTARLVINEFKMKPSSRNIEMVIECQPLLEIYEKNVNGVDLTLIQKKNGGKGDALNMGINASRFSYFVCMDADSKLQPDSLKEIVQPIYEDDTVVAVGGMVVISQCVQTKDGVATGFRLPRNLLISMQAIEYVRTFFASRILMDMFNGNLIISGAFGLFKKATVFAAGGYSVNNLGEDMELVLKIHGYCRNNDVAYKMRYQPRAICMTQAPTNLKDLRGQRRRWHLGLFQSLFIHKRILFNLKFGLVSAFSYVYYLFYELLSPIIEPLGLVTIGLAAYLHVLNVRYMIIFFVLYAIYGGMLSLVAFSQHIHMQRFKIAPVDMLKALFLCLFEFGVFRYILVVIRFAAFLRYGKYKKKWGTISRV